MILSCSNICKSFGSDDIIKNASFHIEDHEKAAIVGINGAGKSTLSKIIVGELAPDSGEVVLGSGKTLGYLAQNQDLLSHRTIYEEMLDAKKSVIEMENRLRDLENSMKTASGEALETMMNQYSRLSHEFELINGYAWKSEIVGVLKGLGFTEEEFSKQISTLSGGQKTRVSLGKLLLTTPDTILLDEPTNHLDMSSIAWLETYLLNYRGAVLIVAHDRYFLDSVTNRIVELDNGKLYSYQANYEGFLELKAERMDMEKASERKRQSILRTELAWMQRGARARSTKQKGRIQRFEALRDKKGPVEDGKVEMESISSRLGRTTIEITDLCKSYGDKVLIKDYTYFFLKDDRIGYIGPNGSGKSTLMKMIAGWVKPDSGTIEIGQTVKLGYFSQENEDMDTSLKVIDYIKNVAEYVKTKDGSISASQMLERFLFPPSVQYTVIEKLSGGERRRLYLLKILMSAPNVLILDEPTNDLDIRTLMILEDYLDSFQGIVITVSHDRYFLDSSYGWRNGGHRCPDAPYC